MSQTSALGRTLGLVLWLGIVGWLSAVGVYPVWAQGAAEPVRLAMELFGVEAEIEIRDWPRDSALAAARAALLEMHQVAQLVDVEGHQAGGLGDLQRAAPGTAVALDQRAFNLLRRTLQFCLWSGGAYSPLGGSVYELWRSGAPAPLELREAVNSAQCAGVALSYDDASDKEDARRASRKTVERRPRASLVDGARLDVARLASSFAIDRAVDSLLKAGITNALVEVGDVVRAIGGGPNGNGWAVEVPGVAGTRHPLDVILLRNQSLSLLGARGPLSESFEVGLIDLRTGVPAAGVVQMATVSEQAVDAKVLSMALYVLGFTEGQRLLGQLDPRPSVLWLLGRNVGTPLESRYRWSVLQRPPQRSGAQY